MIRTTTLCIALCLACATHAVEVFVTALDATCFQCNGVALANAVGGVPPYSYVWSPAPPAGQGTPDATSLCPGEYSVEVTDGMGQTAVGFVTVNMLGGLNMFVPAQELRSACDGGCTGWAVASLATMGGTPPYSFDNPFAEVNGNSVTLPGLCPGTNLVTVTDADGCAGTIQTTIANSGIGFPDILSTSPACGTLPSGSVTMPGEFGADIAYWVQSPTFDSIYNFGSSTGPYLLGGIPPGTHTVYYWWNQGGIDGIPGIAYCTTGTDFTIGSLPGPCGSVQGRVYHDADEDCALNGFDLGQPYRVLSIEPGGQFAMTDGNGFYQRNLAFDTYSIQQPVTPDEVWLCPPTGSADFTLDAGAPLTTIDFANLSTVPHDLSVSLTSTNARPGFGTQVWITVVNNSAFPSGQVDVALSYDALLLAPSTSNWSISPAMAPYASITYTFTASVPADITLLGTVLNYTATVSNAASETNTANNTALLDVTITGSYDPNDKRGWTSSGSSEDQYFLDEDSYIDYTIRFQNTGTDTAFNVVITDTLPANLDPSTLIVGAATHPFNWELRGAGTLKFIFPNIQLPDSNVNEPRSHGHVSFRIKPIEGLVVGDDITNIANIYFDFNPPVITEPSVLNAVSPIRLDASAWLGGAFDDLTGLMHDSLRTLGLLPTTEPYTAIGYIHSGDGGGETIAPSLLATTGPTAIVDWVLLELRDPAQPATALHSRSGLLRRDGRITDKDGNSPVAFNAPVGSYLVALRHRNHLGVMSTEPLSLNAVATNWDVRTTTTPLNGTGATQVDDTRRLLWPGDVDRNGIVRYTGQVNDRDPVLLAIGGVVPTAVVTGVYSPLDVNLDGKIKYVGSANDRDLILQTIGGVVPTAVRQGQLP
ncbi:MAG TPA: hypothetical protein PLB89_15585 [Flavobacteriales bacterium]|nr:hypothetical protein [Flavobacteriales bacterium]